MREPNSLIPVKRDAVSLTDGATRPSSRRISEPRGKLSAAVRLYSCRASMAAQQTAARLSPGGRLLHAFGR